MEVHHHPNIEKKRFKEYFLEFLMIFLAVTLGFFAENIRENIARHNREHQLMTQMVEDLKRDTANMHLHIQITQRKVYSFDTLIALVFESRKNQFPDSTLQKMYYLYTNESKSWGQHDPTTRTLNQLDKENGFGFIRKKAISDSILTYKDLNQISLILSERFRSRQEDAREFSQNIFDYELLSDSVFIPPRSRGADKKISLAERFQQLKFKLLTHDFKTLSIYGAKLADAEIVLSTYLHYLRVKDQFAVRLIKNINQQYGLEKK